MARYIDADKLTDKLEELQFNAPVMTPVMKIYNVIELVEDQPIADVVEVVRCGECKHFGCRYKGISGEDVGYCYNNQNNGFPFLCDSRPCMRATDFCSYGERKET